MKFAALRKKKKKKAVKALLKEHLYEMKRLGIEIFAKKKKGFFKQKQTNKTKEKAILVYPIQTCSKVPQYIPLGSLVVSLFSWHCCHSEFNLVV